LTFAFTTGGNTYRMKEEQLIRLDSTGTVCTSLVKGWADSAVHKYLFGTPLTASVFIAYNAYQDPSNDQIGFAPRAGNIIIINQGVPIGTVVAAIVGSILGATFIVSLIFFFARHRRRPHSDTPGSQPKVKNEFTVEPFTTGAPPNSATPMIPATMRRNGWIIEQGPIDGEPGEGSSLIGVPGSDSPPGTPNGKLPMTTSSPLLAIVRQSLLTDSLPSPEPSPRREVHPVVQTSAALSHSFYGARVPIAPIIPRPEPVPVPDSQQSPPDTVDGPAPPPYSRAQGRLL